MIPSYYYRKDNQICSKNAMEDGLIAKKKKYIYIYSGHAIYIYIYYSVSARSNLNRVHQGLQTAKNQRFLALLVSKLGAQRSLAGSEPLAIFRQKITFFGNVFG